MKKITKKIIVGISVFALILCSFPFTLKADSIENEQTSFSVSIPATTEYKSLVYMFGQYHSTYQRNYISINSNMSTQQLITRGGDTLYVGGYSISPANVEDSVWAFILDYAVIGYEDYLITIDVYALSAFSLSLENWQHIETYQIGTTYSPEDLPFYTLDTDNLIKVYNYSNSQFNGLEQVKTTFSGQILNNYTTLGKILATQNSIAYQNGVNENLATPGWWVKLFNGLDAFFAIELLPNITFGIIFSIPLVFGLLHLILFYWRGN